MKQRKFWFALAGLPLLGLGFFFQTLEPYRPALVISSAASCRMRVDVVEPIGGTPQGYVVLFHGVAANKRIMSYLAQDLANQNLRVFAPDFPGHGKTPGPFWPMRASECGEAFVRELIERRAIVPEQTMLIGHSMGGAIAIRASARIPVAGVIAISPAPMRTTKLLTRDLVFFSDDPPLAANSLVLEGSREPRQMREIARAKVSESKDGTSAYIEVLNATHVSLLFDDNVLSEIRKWTKKLLNTDSEVLRASHLPLYGFLCGFVGLILLCVPFLAEIVVGTGKKLNDAATAAPTTGLLLRLLVVSAISVVILKFWIPLKFLGVFQGDYLASFALLEGLLLLAWNSKSLVRSWRVTWQGLLASGVAATALLLLFGLWFDYSFYEAFLNGPRWARLVPMVAAFFFWHFAEEVFLGAHGSMSRTRRVVLTLAFRSVAWGMIVAALFVLHTGEVLMVLLVLYFVLMSFLQSLAMDVVRRETHSPAAAALFGAILSAGFALAIFPLA